MRLFGDERPVDLAHDDLSSYFLGRDLGAICQDHHRPRIGSFLDMVTPAGLAAHGPWVAFPEEGAERALAAFRSGWESPRAPK
ncbi:MAG: hypothetical protein KF729_06090 [Sandaracinaceae bacterium]|nr:hypothetical protein [Sandaracinaceae bacterium]